MSPSTASARWSNSARAKNGEPIAFALGRNHVITGWEHGITGMAVGGRRTLRIGPDLAYGADGRQPYIPGGATLVFEVEIMGKPAVTITIASHAQSGLARMLS